MVPRHCAQLHDDLWDGQPLGIISIEPGTGGAPPFGALVLEHHVGGLGIALGHFEAEIDPDEAERRVVGLIERVGRVEGGLGPAPSESAVKKEGRSQRQSPPRAQRGM